MKIKKSEYIKYSRTIISKLVRSGCFGEGSMYKEHLISGNLNPKISEIVLEALIKQDICKKKKKKYGWKFYLNIEKIDKIKQIVKEKGRKSIIPILLAL